MLARWVGRDDGLSPAFGKPVAQGPGVIGAVRQQTALGTTDFEQRPGALEVMDVAGCENEGDRAACVVCQRVELRRPAAARGANGMMTSPPFAPAAERWALMWVESTEPVNTPVEPVKA